MEQRVLNLAATFPCVAVTGGRQAGKTTLIKHLFPSHRFVSLDLPSRAEKAETAPALFLEEFPPPLVVDEIQYAPGLFRHLKGRIDAERHTMGQFILTGSQKFPLMKDVTESLAGRTALVALENLSSPELGLTPGDDWPAVLARGFFPELWRQPQLSAEEFYSAFIATYLERDVRQILNVQSLRDFERFLRSCAARSGQLLNLSDLARDVGIKSQTARDWLSVLEASNQVSLLEPYFENIGKRIVKSPKLYLNDPGMLCFLLGLDARALMTSPLVGTVWETFVFAEFRKRARAAPAPSTLWYYRDAQGREVDFIEIRDGRIQSFEVKWLESPDARWIAVLKQAAGLLGRSKVYPTGNAYLMCRTASSFAQDGIHVVHPAVFFSHSCIAPLVGGRRAKKHDGVRARR
jgi:predicted AAA+ superfamily ATPase